MLSTFTCGDAVPGTARDVYIPKLTSALLSHSSRLAGDVTAATEQESGFYAYVTNGDGLRVVDVGDPSSPRIVGSYDTPGQANAVHVLRDHAYVADGAGGLVILRVRKPAPTPRSVTAYHMIWLMEVDGDLSEWKLGRSAALGGGSKDDLIQ